MPNRILNEGICTSDRIASLTDFEFRLWACLLTVVDDAGRGDARPAIIKGRCFALREKVTAKDVDTALHGLAAKGCVSLYTVGGKPYFWLPSWGKYQRIRECKPKYPGPDEDDAILQSAASCGELPQSAALIQSNPNPNPNPNPNVCAEPASGSAPAILLPLNDGTDYPVSQEQCHEWAGLYPAVDVIQQLRAMRGWLLSNPTKRKTKRGIERFITGWLSREQDRGYRGSGKQASSQNRQRAPDDVKGDMERMQRFLQKQREESGNGV